ncbi:1-phosphofructokinase family hexose kinase [Amycolatopsis arida]|uniref:1-phosphofructokinase family hexose kinase n=1 Tax=Amycolatopsis arida TaxID=587909 RepID=UPI000B1E1051|nr:hexose kinase [Amycolatopsis arida]
MILTVTPNTALDVTYTVHRLVPGEVHRVREARHRAGGKGVNVARVLHTLGVPTRAIGTAGGADGAAVATELRRAGIPHELVPVAGPTRRTVTLVSAVDNQATLVNEPGAELAAAEWDRLLAAVRSHVDDAAVLVCSGSLPPGAPVDGYAVLLALAPRIPTVLDTAGPALLAALPARPTVVKPNVDELRAATGVTDPPAAARALRRAGAGAVVVSRGAAGLLAVTGEGTWSVRPSAPLAGNATGAGDAAVAGIAMELAAGARWPDVLRRAAATSAAAVLGPLAGDLDLIHYRRELRAVTPTPEEDPCR